MTSVPGLSVVVHPAGKLEGCMQVPGDKSISHRVAMLSGLASGKSVMNGFLQSDDCINTLRAMERLGARVYRRADEKVKVVGTAGKMLQPAGRLDMGNSGTGMRLLSGLLAGYPMTTVLTGDESLRSRPMQRIKIPLEQMGARIELQGEGGCAPMLIEGGPLKGIEYTLPVASAQVKSCVLLAGLMADGLTIVIEPKPTRDHTERLLKTLGFAITVDGLRITVEGSGGEPIHCKGRNWHIPGDFSSAAFFIAAAAGRPGAALEIENVGLNPRRDVLLDVLKRMGADIRIKDPQPDVDGEPTGTVCVQGAVLKGVEVGGAEIPALIDELPLVAVLGAVAEGVTTIRDAAELRVKESDRIACMVENLRRLEVDVEEREDGMVIRGPARLDAEERINSYGDHRVAMAMAVLALYARQPLCINNTACVATSYPGFWEDLRGLGVYVEG